MHVRKYNESLDYHRQSLVLCPHNPATYSAMGFSYSLQGNYLEAVDCFHKVFCQIFFIFIMEFWPLLHITLTSLPLINIFWFGAMAAIYLRMALKYFKYFRFWSVESKEMFKNRYKNQIYRCNIPLSFYFLSDWISTRSVLEALCERLLTRTKDTLARHHKISFY